MALVHLCDRCGDTSDAGKSYKTVSLNNEELGTFCPDCFNQFERVVEAFIESNDEKLRDIVEDQDVFATVEKVCDDCGVSFEGEREAVQARLEDHDCVADILDGDTDKATVKAAYNIRQVMKDNGWMSTEEITKAAGVCQKKFRTICNTYLNDVIRTRNNSEKEYRWGEHGDSKDQHDERPEGSVTSFANIEKFRKLSVTERVYAIAKVIRVHECENIRDIADNLFEVDIDKETREYSEVHLRVFERECFDKENGVWAVVENRSSR